MPVITKKNKDMRAPLFFLIALLIISLFMCVLRLGAFNTVSTSYAFSEWREEGVETVVFHTESKEEISSVWFYLTTPNVPKVNDAKSNTITARIHYSSSLNGTYFTKADSSVEINNALSSAGKWYCISDLAITSSYRYIELAVDCPCKIGEVVFLNGSNKTVNFKAENAGLALDFKAESSYSHGNFVKSENKIALASALTDEQKLFDYSNVVLDENGSKIYKTDSISRFYEREIPILDTVLGFIGNGNYVSPLANPLGYELLSIPALLFGVSTFTLRIVPLIFFVLSVFAVYSIGKLLFKNSLYGVISAFIYTVFGYGFNMAGVLSVDTMFLAFTLFAFYYLMRYYLKGVDGDYSFKGYLNVIPFGIFYALSFSVSTKAIITVIPFLIIFIAGLIKQFLVYKTEKQKITEKNIGADEQKLNSKLKTIKKLYQDKLLKTIVLFIAVSVVLTALVAFIAGTVSYKLLGVAYGTEKSVFQAFVSHIKAFFGVNYVTSFDSVNKYNALAYIFNFGAEKISDGVYITGNSVFALVGVFSLALTVMFTVISYLNKESIKKQGIVLVTATYFITCLANLLIFNFGIGDYLLPSAFMTFIMVYAYILLTEKDKKALFTVNGKKFTVTNIIGVVLLVLGTVDFILRLSGVLLFTATL